MDKDTTEFPFNSKQSRLLFRIVYALEDSDLEGHEILDVLLQFIIATCLRNNITQDYLKRTLDIYLVGYEERRLHVAELIDKIGNLHDSI